MNPQISAGSISLVYRKNFRNVDCGVKTKKKGLHSRNLETTNFRVFQKSASFTTCVFVHVYKKTSDPKELLGDPTLGRDP